MKLLVPFILFLLISSVAQASDDPLGDLWNQISDFLTNLKVTGYVAAGGSCNNHWDCDSGLYCSNNVCTAKKGSGESCLIDEACTSNFCDSVTMYTSICCDPTGKQTTSGCCQSQSDCYGFETCTDYVCVMKTNIQNGGYCYNNAQCASGYCNNYYCCSSGTCCSDNPNVVSCPTGQTCGSNYQCVSITNLANGASCTANSQCTSGNCQNGMCCASGNVCCSTQSQCTSAGYLRCNEAHYCEAYTENGGYCISGDTCTSRNCKNYVCCEAGKNCCTTNSHCTNDLGSMYTCGSNYYCIAGQLKADGQSCTKNTECTSGNCYNNLCCAAGQKCCKTWSDCEFSQNCGTNYYCVEKPKKANGENCTSSYDCQSDNCGFYNSAYTICCESGKTCCRSNSECPFAYTCGSNYYCVSSTPKKIEGQSCTSNSECSSNYCGNNICCQSGKTCCTSDSNCPQFYVCNKNSGNYYCVEKTGVVTGGSCSSNTNCASGNCQKGVCCASGQSCCSSNSDCYSGYECNLTKRYCVSTTATTKKSDGSTCSYGSDCQSGNCNNGICCASGKTCCSSNSQCSSGYTCGSSYYCIQSTTKKADGVSCLANSDCQSGNCKNSVCCVSGKTCCGSNSDCPTDYECDYNYFYCKQKTTTKKANGELCTSASECSGGYCVHLSCRSSSTYCGDYYCDTGETCTSCSSDCGSCKKSDGSSCDYNSDCQSGNCQNYICCASGKTCCNYNYECSGDYFCGPNYYCVSTTPKKENYQSCSVGSDCESGNCNTVNGWNSIGLCCPSGVMCCNSSNDCFSGEICSNKICTKQIATTTKKSNGESCNSASECSGGYCVRGFCSSGPTYCGDNVCDFGENYKTCSFDCPAPPIKKEDGQYCKKNDDCASDNCKSNICCSSGECCIFDSQCTGGYCDEDSSYCKPLLAEGMSCSGYWMCESKNCDGVCKKGEGVSTKVLEPIKVNIVIEENEAVCGNDNCEVHLGENCENCQDCSIYGGCCSRDSLYVSLPFLERGVSEMKDSNEVGGVVPNHKAIFPHEVIKGGMSYTTLIKDLGYTDYKICCNENIKSGDCCTNDDCSEGYRCTNNRCTEIAECSKNEDCSNTQVCSSGRCMKATRTFLFIPINYGNSLSKQSFGYDVSDRFEILKDIYGEVSCNPKFRALISYSDCKIENSCSIDVLDKITKCAVALGREYSDADYYVGLSSTILCPTASGFSTVGVGRTIYSDLTNPYTVSHEFGHILGLTDEYCWIDWPEAPEPQYSFDLDAEHICGPNTPYPNPLSAEYGCDTSKPKSSGGCCDEWCSGTVHSKNDFRAHITDCCKGNIYTNKDGEIGVSIMSKTSRDSAVVGLDEPSMNWVDSMLCW